MSQLQRIKVLESGISPVTLIDARDRIISLATKGKSSVVCLANVHMVVTALNDPKLRNAMDRAELVLPDGMPIVRALRKTKRDQERIAGYDIIIEMLKKCENDNIRVTFAGSTQKTLDLVRKNIKINFPRLDNPQFVELPFFSIGQPISDEQIEKISSLPSGVMFVGLGCPKQEIWMDQIRPYSNSVMLGVGAAFHLLSGEFSRAPAWVRNLYLEWLFRLFQEPKKLLGRYLTTNTRFIMLSLFNSRHKVS